MKLTILSNQVCW